MFKVVENDREIRNLEIDNHLETKNKKDRFSSVKEIQRNHISLDSHNVGKAFDSHSNSKFSDKFQMDASIFSKTDTSQSSNRIESKTVSNNASSQENLSFSQRAELVNSKLMAHKDDFKRTKAPAPPTPKKPVNTESAISNWALNNHEKSADVFKSKNVQGNSHFSSEHQILSSSSHHMGSSESMDGLGAKPKVFLKKVKDNKGSDAPFMHSSSKYDLNEISPFSSSKCKKESIDIADIELEGEGLKLVHVKQPTTFSLYAPWLKQDDVQVTVTGRKSKGCQYLN